MAFKATFVAEISGQQTIEHHKFTNTSGSTGGTFNTKRVTKIDKVTLILDDNTIATPATFSKRAVTITTPANKNGTVIIAGTGR